MIVCSCRVISDREIRAAMADGARRCGDVFRRCGSGPQCGSCVPLIREMLAMMPGAADVCAGALAAAGAD